MATRIVIAIIAIILIIGAIVWINQGDEELVTPVLSVSAFNQTKNVNASDTPAATNDMIEFTLTAENQSDEVIPGYILEANISEITDKATLIDASGASYNSATNSLVWTPLDIQANESVNQKFTVRVNQLPANTSNPALRIKFNNELAIAIQQSSVSGGNVTTPPTSPTGYVAPTSGVSEWLPVIFAALVTLVVLYRRSRLGITSQI
jgi:hypothetical protein